MQASRIRLGSEIGSQEIRKAPSGIQATGHPKDTDSPAGGTSAKARNHYIQHGSIIQCTYATDADKFYLSRRTSTLSNPLLRCRLDSGSNRPSVKPYSTPSTFIT
ncbi:hypothetical protein WAI453_002483 [Rhynchosporium graminicola]